MYRIVEVKDKVRVAPDKFGMSLQAAVKASIEEKLEGSIEKNLGVVLSVDTVKEVGEGIMLAGDGALYYPVTFTLLTYVPEQNELVRGEVIDVTEFGVFLRMGPVDGMVHVSQLMDDFVSYDSKNMMFTGKKSGRKVKEASQVMARVISVSVQDGQYKIGLTARQPGLGEMEWLKKKGEAPVKREEAKPAPKKK